MMINQSIMTGTPVVSFEMGVSEDLVLTAKTGYRAAVRNSIDLAKGIDCVLSLTDDEHEKMCETCRTFAIHNYTFNISTEKIIELMRRSLKL